MKTHFHWKRRILHGLTLLAILTVALGMPSPALAAPPSNDEIENAIAFPAPSGTATMADTDFVQSTVALDDPVISCNGGPGLKTVWYSFVPDSYGLVTIDTFGSEFDTVLAVWTGTRGSLQAVTCNDDAANPGIYNNSEIKNLPLRPGVHYYIEVAQFTGGGAAPQKDYSGVRDIGPLVSTNYLTVNLSFTSVPFVEQMYDNTDPKWTYTGLWRTVAGKAYYSGSIHAALTLNSTATFTFTGNQFKLYFTQALSYGKMEVSVDGAYVDTIIQTSQILKVQQTWTSPKLAEGPHTVQVKNLLKYINIDAISIASPPDLIDPGAITTLAAAPGSGFGTADLTWTATGDDGADGNATAYQVRYATSAITDLATWNAATPVATGMPIPKAPGSAEAMSVSGLTPGLTYFFAVRAQDEQGNLGPVGNSPSTMTGFAGPPVQNGIHDNLKTNWMYSGLWARTSAAPAYLGSYHISKAIGNSAAIVFDGIKFTFIYSMNGYQGNLDVYVDDVFVGRINQFSSAAKYQQKFISPTFSPGQHTAKFVHATGRMANVDAIDVIQTPDTDNPAAVGNLAAVTGTGNGNVNLSWGAPVEDAIAGTGTVSYYLGRYSVNPIVTDADWDAATPIAGMPAPKPPLGAEAKTVTGLAPGVLYYFSVRAADDFDNLGPIVSASARAKSPLPVGAGKYDNRDARILYTSWVLSAQAGAYLSTIHYSTVVGRNATLVFTGSDFSFIYTRDTIFGDVEVWVDGVLAGVVNQKGAKATQQVWRYSDYFGTLTAGQHTVEFRHAGGARVNLDAIEIFP